MSTIFIERASASQAQNSNVIITIDIRSSVLLALEEHSNAEIIIVSNDEEAYSDAKIACSYKVKFHLNNVTTSTSKMKPFERALFLFELANTYSECEEAKKYLIHSLLQSVPSIIREEQAISLIQQASNNTFKTTTIKNFQIALQKEKDTVRENISISENNEHVTFVDIPYGEELANHIVNLHNSDLDSINIMNTFFGGGKSITSIKAFNKFCDQGSTTIATGSSRALMSSQLSKNDLRYDINALKSRTEQKGILGVVNTVLMNDNFAKQRQASEVFMVDEIEEVLNHMSGGAVGDGTLKDQVRIYSRFEEQMKQSKTVVIADALTSEFTLDYLIKLAKESGKKIFVYKQESTRQKPVIKFMSENMNIAAARENLKANKKIAAFSDKSHNKTSSKFNTLYNTINPTNGFSIKIDAAFMQNTSTKRRLSSADALADDMVAIFYNSAAKCGLSIQNGEYKDTHVFGCGTVFPNDYIQAPGRFRNTETVYQSFSNTNYRLPPQTAWAILSNIMNKECSPEEFTQEKQQKLFEDPMVKTVLARIEYKNKMKKNYQNKVLFMYEILGFEVQFIEDEAAQVTNSRKSKKKGSKIEKELRQKGLIVAKKITKKEAKQLRSCGDFNSQNKKNELESFDIRTFYKVLDITDDLLNFDNEAQGRKVISNMMIVRGNSECTNINSCIKLTMLNKFFEIMGLDTFSFGSYTSSDAEAFKEFLYYGEINVGERVIPAKEAFHIALPNVKITKRAMSIVTSVLKTAFMTRGVITKSRKSVNGRTEWIYKAKLNPFAQFRYMKILRHKRA
jgi:hypothetical protein